MKKLILILLSAALLAPAGTDAKAEKDILAALDIWRQAVIKRDRAALEKVLHPDLVYCHSNGLIENRAQQIQHMVGSSVDYEAIDFADTVVRFHGAMALVTGKVVYHQVSKKGDKTVTNLAVLSVWTKGPQGWQMIGRQSTRPNG